MKHRIPWLLCFLCLASSVAAQETPLITRASLAMERGDTAWTGQRVVLQIDVLSSEGWANLPVMPNPRIPGVLVYRPDSAGVRLGEKIDGKDYSGQRQELWLYPQGPGTYRVPELELTARVRVFGADGGDRDMTAKTNVIAFTAKEPPGANPDLPLVTATQFEVTQTWEPELDEAAVGDGITRVIRMKADGVPGMVLPVLAHPEIAAVRPYPKQPSVTDSLDRGALKSERRDAITLVFQGEGRFELPALEMQWWNPKTESLEDITVPGKIIDISPAATSTTSAASSTPARTSSRTVALLVLIALALAAALWRFRRTIARRWRAYLEEKAQSEPASYRAFEKAAASNDPAATFNALMRWLDTPGPVVPAPPASLASFVATWGNEELAAEATRLVAAVNHPTTNDPWSGAGLRAGIRAARQKMLRAQKRVRAGAQALPPLNS